MYIHHCLGYRYYDKCFVFYKIVHTFGIILSYKFTYVNYIVDKNRIHICFSVPNVYFIDT